VNALVKVAVSHLNRIVTTDIRDNVIYIGTTQATPSPSHTCVTMSQQEVGR
jgi:hypothetical protein